MLKSFPLFTALVDLNGRFFAGREVRASFFDYDKYLQGDLESKAWTTRIISGLGLGTSRSPEGVSVSGLTPTAVVDQLKSHKQEFWKFPWFDSLLIGR